MDISVEVVGVFSCSRSLSRDWEKLMVAESRADGYSMLAGLHTATLLNSHEICSSRLCRVMNSVVG